MAWCHNCGAEYVPGVKVCPDCELELFDEPRSNETTAMPAPTPPMSPEARNARTEYLGRYDEFEAEVILEILRERGILAFAKQEREEGEATGYHLIDGSDRGVILVASGRRDEALAIIAEELPRHLEEIQRAMQTLSEGMEDQTSGE